jgi:hypothetical protein
MTDLHFCTNAELIKELIGRPTFRGLILSADDEHRDPRHTHRDFGVSCSITDKAEVLSLVRGLAFSLAVDLDDS